MLREGELDVVRVHAVAVIDHLDKPDPGVLQLHRNAPRPGVERILDQLLDHRRGPLYDLARGDAIDDERVEDVDVAHGRRSAARPDDGASGVGAAA